MKKRTLQFTSLKDLTQFSQQLTNGYIINTTSLAITGLMSDLHYQLSLDMYGAQTIDSIKRKPVEEDLFA